MNQVLYEQMIGRNIQFSKAPNMLRGMGLTHLPKGARAIKELAGKGMAPD